MSDISPCLVVRLAEQALQLDPAVPTEAQLARHWHSRPEDFAGDRLRDLLAAGYATVHNGLHALLRERVAAGQVCSARAETSALHTALETRDRELQALRSDFHARVDQEVAMRVRLRAEADASEARARTLEQTLESARQAEHYRGMYEALHAAQHDQARLKLQDENARLREQVDVLSRSNAGKGNLGECSVAEWLRRALPDAEVRDVSKAKSSCDLHVRLAPAAAESRALSDALHGTRTEFFFAVEVKNKRAVTREDVDKFYRDVDHLAAAHGRAFLGGLFLSLGTRNIPGRGDFMLETRGGGGGGGDAGVVVMFVGLDSALGVDDQRALLSCLLPVFLHVTCRTLASAAREAALEASRQPSDARAAELEADLRRVAEHVAAHLQRASAVQERIKAARAAMTSFCDALSTELAKDARMFLMLGLDAQKNN